MPQVDSVLVGLRGVRGPGGRPARCARSCTTAFAHRRKALAGSLALAPGAAPGVRERARAALVELGHPADERAERLSPEEFSCARGAGSPGREAASRGRRAKVNLCLFLGPVRADGRHELVTVFESVSLADDLGAARSRFRLRRGRVPRRLGPNIVARRLVAGCGSGAGTARRCGSTIDKRIPVAGGMGGGSADAAAPLRMAAALAPVPVGEVEELAASLGADVPSQLAPGLALGTGAGDVVEPLAPLAPHAFVIVPQPTPLVRDRGRLPGGRPPGLCRATSPIWRTDCGPCAPAGCPRSCNDLEPAALSLRPGIADALDAVRGAGAVHAMVSGSGPTVFGLFTAPDGLSRADAAAHALADRYPGATSAAL